MDKVELYCKALHTTCTSSEVCKFCAESNPSAIWLAGLMCTHPEEHHGHPTVTVVCSSWKGLVRVRQLPSSITELEKVTRSKDIVRNTWAHTCSHGDECTTAHTDEEVAFWRWQIIKKLYAQLVSRPFLDVYHLIINFTTNLTGSRICHTLCEI